MKLKKNCLIHTNAKRPDIDKTPFSFKKFLNVSTTIYIFCLLCDIGGINQHYNVIKDMYFSMVHNGRILACQRLLQIFRRMMCIYSQTTTVIKYIICHNGQLSSANGISSCHGEFMGLRCGLKNIISFRNRQSIGNGI